MMNKCPLCDSPTRPFNLNTLARPVDPRLFRLAQQQRVCHVCGWQSEGVEEVRLQDLCSEVRGDGSDWALRERA